MLLNNASLTRTFENSNLGIDSCVVKFTQIINVVSKLFGFKPGFDTKGVIFAQQGMISHHINKIQKLHCCSIDYKRAFDTHCR